MKIYEHFREHVRFAVTLLLTRWVDGCVSPCRIHSSIKFWLFVVGEKDSSPLFFVSFETKSIRSVVIRLTSFA